MAGPKETITSAGHFLLGDVMSEFEKVMKQLEEIIAKIEAINEALRKAKK